MSQIPVWVVRLASAFTHRCSPSLCISHLLILGAAGDLSWLLSMGTGREEARGGWGRADGGMAAGPQAGCKPFCSFSRTVSRASTELLSQPQGACHCACGGLVLAQGGIWNATGSPYGSLSGNVLASRPGRLQGIFIEPVNKQTNLRIKQKGTIWKDHTYSLQSGA